MSDPSGHRHLVIVVAQDITTLLRAWGRSPPAGWPPMDLTGRQLRVLMKLYKDGPASMHEIGEWIGVSPSSSTSFVDRLADRGLVERVRRQLDRRVIEAGLTAVGRELIDRLVTADFEAREEILSGLSTAELTDLRRLVRRLIGVADEVARARARGEASGPG